MYRILEHPTGIPRPVSIILTYAALDFNFTSWMSPANLRVLRSEQSEVHIPGIMQGKDHMRHKSPLSVVDDVKKQPRSRQQSWGQALGAKLSLSPMNERSANPLSSPSAWTKSLPRSMSTKVANWLGATGEEKDTERGEITDSEEVSESDDETETIRDFRNDKDKSLRERVKTPRAEQQFFDIPPTEVQPVVLGEKAEVVEPSRLQVKKKKKAGLGTRLTMTSRSGYFQDRTISPSMVSFPHGETSNSDGRCAQWRFCTSAPNGIPISRRITISHRS